jgi:hypothetical protein
MLRQQRTAIPRQESGVDKGAMYLTSQAAGRTKCGCEELSRRNARSRARFAPIQGDVECRVQYHA